MSFSGDLNKILKKLKNGESCFEQLYDLTYKHLLVVARLYLKDKSMAEDVLADAYISVYKNIDLFDVSKNGYNWMCKIVQNKAYNCNRLSHFDDELKEDLESGVDYFADIDVQCDLGKAISKLDLKEKELIYLRFFEDKTYAEIAKRMCVSAPMVHKSIKKILKKLEKWL